MPTGENSRNVDDVYRLSPMQELMLLHSLSDPTSRVLSNQFCYEIRGPLDVDAFEQAWQSLVERHAGLRTAFLWEGLPHPVQAVRKRAKLSCEVHDLRALSAADRRSRLGAIQAEDLGRGIDVAKPPLMRLTLARLGDDASFLIWNSHHLVLDRWCLDTVFHELAAFYASALDGSPASLPPAARFRDYIAWIQRQDPAAAESYWRAVLRGFREPTLIAGAGPLSHERRSWTRSVSLETDTALRAFAKANGLTLAAVLQGAIAMWLAGETRRSDVVFGLTVSGRPADLPQAESAVGSFVNNLPLRVRLRPNERLVDWLRSLQVAQARRSRFDYVSPAQVGEWSEMPGGSPLFDVLALVNPAAPQATQWPGLEVEQVSGTLATAYPLTVAVGADGNGLSLAILAEPNVFGARRATAALDEISRILGEMSAVDKTLGAIVPLAVASATASTPVRPPNGPTEIAASASAVETLSQIWGGVLGLDSVGLDQDLFAMGATSLQIARAFAEIERRFGRSLPLSTLFRAGSIRGLLDELGEPDERTPSLVEIQPRGDRPQLFVVPGIGGNVVGFSGLARALAGSQPFYGLQSRGLDGLEEPRTSIEEIAADFVAELRGAAREPFVLLGFCWGAAVALEMAHLLAAANPAPALLALVDPAYLGSPRPPSAASAPQAKFVAQRLELYWRELRESNGAERRRWLREKAGRALSLAAGGASQENRTEMRQFRVTEANREALLRYEPKLYRGPACLFLTEGRSPERGAGEHKAWLDLLEPEPQLRSIPGADSGDTLTPANVGAFADALRVEIDAVVERNRTAPRR